MFETDSHNQNHDSPPLFDSSHVDVAEQDDNFESCLPFDPAPMIGGQVGGGSGQSSDADNRPVRVLRDKIKPTAHAVKFVHETAQRRKEKYAKSTATDPAGAIEEGGPTAETTTHPDAGSNETSGLPIPDPVPPYCSQTSQPPISEFNFPPYPTNSFQHITPLGYLTEILSPDLDPHVQRQHSLDPGSSSNFCEAGLTAPHHQQATFYDLAKLMEDAAVTASPIATLDSRPDQPRAANPTSTRISINDLTHRSDIPASIASPHGHTLSYPTDNPAASIGTTADAHHSAIPVGITPLHEQTLAQSSDIPVTSTRAEPDPSDENEVQEAVSDATLSSPTKGNPGAVPAWLESIITECVTEIRRIITAGVKEGQGKLNFDQMLGHVFREFKLGAPIPRSNGWNSYEKYFAANKEEEMRLSNVDPPVALDAVVSLAVVSKCYESFQLRHPNFSQILQTYVELQMCTPRVMSYARRAQHFRSGSEKLRKLITEFHEKYNFETIVLMTGSKVDLDLDLNDAIFTPFAKGFFQEQANVDISALMDRYKGHVFNRAAASRCLIDFGVRESPKTPSSGSISQSPQCPSPLEKVDVVSSNDVKPILSAGPATASAHTPKSNGAPKEGNTVSTSMLTRFKESGGTKKVQELLRDRAAEMGHNFWERAHFPWAKMIALLVTNKLTVHNWPELCPFPGKETNRHGQVKGKGISGLSQLQQVSLYGALQEDAEYPLHFQRFEGPEQEHTKLIFGVLPAPGSNMKQRVYTVSVEERRLLTGYRPGRKMDNNRHSVELPLTASSSDEKREPSVEPEIDPPADPVPKRAQKVKGMSHGADPQQHQKAQKPSQEGGGSSQRAGDEGEQSCGGDNIENESESREIAPDAAFVQEPEEIRRSPQPRSFIASEYAVSLGAPSTPPPQQDAFPSQGTAPRGAELSPTGSCVSLPPSIPRTPCIPPHSPRSMTAHAAPILAQNIEEGFGKLYSRSTSQEPTSARRELGRPFRGLADSDDGHMESRLATSARREHRRPSRGSADSDDGRMESRLEGSVATQPERGASVEPEYSRPRKRQCLEVPDSNGNIQPYRDGGRYPTPHYRQGTFPAHYPVPATENPPSGWHRERRLPFESRLTLRPATFEDHPSQRRDYVYGYPPPPPSGYQDDYDVYQDAYTSRPPGYAPQQTSRHYYGSRNPEWDYR